MNPMPNQSPQHTIPLWIAASLFALSCTPKAPTPPPLPTTAADAILAADLDGDGSDEWISVHNGTIAWNASTAKFEAGVASYGTTDLNGDGADELIVAMRRTRDYPKAKPRLFVISGSEHTTYMLPIAGKHRITNVDAANGRVFVTALGNNKRTVGGWWSPAGFEPVTESIMGMVQVPLGDGRVAIGRLYGDEPKSHGRLEIRGPDGTVTPLDGVRGVRTLAAADLNADGHIDLISADGWHFRYGEQAEARLSLYLGPSFTERRMIGTLKGDYTIERIDVVETVPPTLVVSGTSTIAKFALDGLGWTPIQLGSVSEGTVAAVATVADETWVSWPGEPPTVVNLTAN